MSAKKVSERSTKQELLAAYEELAKQTQTGEGATPSLTETKNTRSVGHKEYSLMEDVLTCQQNLADATTAFSNGMNIALEGLAREREAHAQQMHEQKETWRREREAYSYDRDLNRRKEEIEYERKRDDEDRAWSHDKARREQAIAEREAVIKAREAEMKEFERQVRDFPAQLEKAAKEAADKARAEVDVSARTKADLLEKDAEREREISKLKIQSFEETIKRQSAHVSSLQAQLQQAQERSQSLAVTVIEGDARKRATQEKVDTAAKL